MRRYQSAAMWQSDVFKEGKGDSGSSLEGKEKMQCQPTARLKWNTKQQGKKPVTAKQALLREQKERREKDKIEHRTTFEQ